MKRKTLIAASFLVAAVLFVIATRTLGLFAPAGVETKGDSSTLVGYLALATSVISLLTGIVSLLKSAVELQKAKVQGGKP